MIGKLSTIIGFLRDFFSFMNKFAIPQIKEFISNATTAVEALNSALGGRLLSFVGAYPLYLFILGITAIACVKMIINR